MHGSSSHGLGVFVSTGTEKGHRWSFEEAIEQKMTTNNLDRKTNLPLVSVVIPSYNHARYVGQAIESVLSQTYPNIELIVVDDGSKDGSREVIRELANRHGFKTLLNEVNRGQSHAFNSAIELARGEFISLLPSDDWYLPRKTEAQIARFMECEKSVGVVYAAGLRYFEDLDETRPVVLPVKTGRISRELILLGNFVYPVTPLFRREVLEEFRPNEQFRAEGEAVYIRMGMKYDFEYVDEVVAVMRDHSYNIGKNAHVMHGEIERYWDWFFSLPDLPREIRELESYAHEKNHRTKGMQFVVSQRDFKLGRKCLLQALKLKPASLLSARFMGALTLSLMPAPVSNAILDLRKTNKAQSA
jgi:alpha-1,3-rhamnosyltransferase